MVLADPRQVSDFLLWNHDFAMWQMSVLLPPGAVKVSP
jgi:hypothetical protein